MVYLNIHWILYSRMGSLINPMALNVFRVGHLCCLKIRYCRKWISAKFPVSFDIAYCLSWMFRMLRRWSFWAFLNFQGRIDCVGHCMEIAWSFHEYLKTALYRVHIVFEWSFDSIFVYILISNRSKSPSSLHASSSNSSAGDSTGSPASMTVSYWSRLQNMWDHSDLAWMSKLQFLLQTLRFITTQFYLISTP